jgi:GNAT superfamily N-acetyltransferase
LFSSKKPPSVRLQGEKSNDLSLACNAACWHIASFRCAEEFGRAAQASPSSSIYQYAPSKATSPIRVLPRATSDQERGIHMQSDLSIRPVKSEDYDQWLPLWDGYNAFYGRSGATALADEVTRTTWARFLDADEPVYALVAARDGELVGLAHYLFHRSTTAIELSCYLQDLFTGERARGKGVGRALIERVYREAMLAGSPRVYWHTHETNRTAMQLYDKVADYPGFVVYRKLL